MASPRESDRYMFSLPTQVELQACWELCRLHNNIGFWVVYLPTVWSIAMAYHTHQEITFLQAFSCAMKYVPLCFGIKSLIMTIDDILDADVDKLVERTKLRPVPRGAITMGRAWLFFFIQAVIGLGLSVTSLSPTSLRVVSVVWPLYIIYPTCKARFLARWMNFAPIPLGLMFNVGTFMGWADLTHESTLPWNVLVPIYVGTCLWTITYETVYQHQDKIDDVKIGLHSPALLLGSSTIPVCATTGVGFFALLAYAGALNGHGWCYYSAVVFACILLMLRLSKTDIDKPEDCKSFFLQTVPVGQIILSGIVGDVILNRLVNNIAL